MTEWVFQFLPTWCTKERPSPKEFNKLFLKTGHILPENVDIQLETLISIHQVSITEDLSPSECNINCRTRFSIYVCCFKKIIMVFTLYMYSPYLLCPQHNQNQAIFVSLDSVPDVVHKELFEE